jgi:DNA polymerase I-like protein with 3'-5' exonuclease and polymerase domains
MSDIGNGNDSQRQWGKKANHALNYDMGYKKFAYIYEIGEKEAKRIYKKYHSAYPGVKKFHNKVKNSLRKNRTIENLFGRKRRYFLRWGSQLFTEAYSFIPQSTVADKINEHGVLFIYENQDLMPEVEFLNQIHDSIVFQIPVDVGWKRHEELLGLIIDSLETTIHYEGRPLNIPAETNIMPENFKEGYEFASKPSAEELEEKYNELTG